jgi:maltooligosyltrehalose trehalohydrolase
MRKRLGASLLTSGRCEFRVWAPGARELELKLVEQGSCVPMKPEGGGYFVTSAPVSAGTPYMFRIDGQRERPDPASRLQSEGVHGPSRVVDLAYDWQDARWQGVPLWQYVIYELHVGTFSGQGTFDGIVPELARLRELGVTAVEIMPVAQFPGTRNWGYDGVYPFAVQDSYGGPRSLQRLVDACHGAGLAVVLDVVYNHLGPEGNYLGDYGPYFTDKYKTPWGSALNFDDAQSEGARRFFIENALQWVEDFHIDALRLDAVHAIIDRSATPFLEELAQAVHRRGEELGRHVYLIAESDLNDARLVRPSAAGGHGLDAMWCDDFHHAAHALISGERSGYYVDFGAVEDLARAWRSAMSRPGEFSPFRQRVHGRPASDLRPEQCVVCTQNHDQVGNRLLGERSSVLLSFEQRKLSAGVLCLAPFIPLLFMGEEYGEPAPFLYFVSHGEPDLLEAVRRGRCDEFSYAGLEAQAADPGSDETYRRCMLNHQLRNEGEHAHLHGLYRHLLQLRARLAPTRPDDTTSYEGKRVLVVQRAHRAWLAFCFSPEVCRLALPMAPGGWRLCASSASTRWGGPSDDVPELVESRGELELTLQPYSFVAYEQRVESADL